MPQAVDDLKKVSSDSAFGQFVWLSIRNAEGLEIGRMADSDHPRLQTLIQDYDSKAVASGNQIALTLLAGPGGNPVYAIGLNIIDSEGQLKATLRLFFDTLCRCLCQSHDKGDHGSSTPMSLGLRITNE